jgi:hypothetical protein
MAQPARRQHLVAVEDHRVFQRAAQGQARARIASTSDWRQKVRLSDSSRTKAPLAMFSRRDFS